MRNYIQEQSAGEIIKGVFDIYGRNFLTIFLIYVLPLLPVTFLQAHARAEKDIGLTGIASLLYLVVMLFVLPAITVAVSDICVGNKVGFWRSYRRAFGKTVLQYWITYLLLTLVLLGGFLLLIIPGVILSLQYMFTMQVVVLERLWGRKALKRSKALGKGFYVRNVGIILLLMIFAMFAGGVLGGLFGLFFPQHLTSWVFKVFIDVLNNLIGPISLIGSVLLYYDMRVRKEGYDATTLVEELRH
jgi:hypothetical protein